MNDKDEPPRISDDEALRWQREFPGLATTVHVANCSHGPQSSRSRGAINAYLDSWEREGMDWDLWMEEVSRAREAFARLIGAKSTEVAVSTSASAAVASVASAIDASGSRRRVVQQESGASARRLISKLAGTR